MKHLMLFVDGFEDVEAIATLDVLLRGNLPPRQHPKGKVY